MYDEARALAPDTARLWQDLLSAYIERADMALVIDLGCGTGRFSELMAAHSVSKWIGVSRERRLPPPTGRAIEIPLRADSFLARLSDDDFQQRMAALRTPWQRNQPGRCSYRRN